MLISDPLLVILSQIERRQSSNKRTFLALEDLYIQFYFIYQLRLYNLSSIRII